MLVFGNPIAIEVMYPHLFPPQNSHLVDGIQRNRNYIFPGGKGDS